jgi:hypothetical protein
MTLAAELGLRLALRRARGASREETIDAAYELLGVGLGVLRGEREPDREILRNVRGALASAAVGA